MGNPRLLSRIPDMTERKTSLMLMTIFWAVAQIQDAESVSWGYQADTVDELPPTEWNHMGGSCNGSRQSPIQIDSRAATNDPDLSPIEYVRYNVTPLGHQWIVWNNGHTAQFNGVGITPPEIYGAGLTAHYVLTQFHFHWGSDDQRGSEHTIDDKHYPLEVHMVHRRSTDFDAQILTDPVGMAVISVLFDAINGTEPPNAHIDQMLEALSQEVAANSSATVTLADFRMQDLLPEPRSYYRYVGSLTTPPCAEAVVWTVMKQPLKITEKQLSLFRALKTFAGSEGNNLADNFRPQQNLNGRVVSVYNDPDADATSQ